MHFYVFLLSSSSHQNKQPAIVPPGKYSVTEQIFNADKFVLDQVTEWLGFFSVTA
jgi:hypothetical protein